MKKLKRYWFSFEKSGVPTPLNLGCGVTAYGYDDAITLLHKHVFGTENLPPIVQCVEDVDVSTLDQKHVLPNIGLVTVRGMWFPQGYGDMS